jgi:hypothetical protein
MTDDELLTPKSADANDALKAALLARTSRRVRMTRRLRIATRVAAGLACFAAGVATTFLRPESQSVTTVASVRTTVAAFEPAPPAPPRTLSPAELELEAEKATVKAESARLFREAGNRFLLDHADYRGALRCYRNFLNEADPADRAVSAEDTWLLTSLKRAREQENAQ